ncbi:MAG: hypothetical protein B7Y56_08680 [Gallionellales bacterium 35-53-114]|jgi:Ca-activated chloride channel family protein|nr:MAG: hypothetical protein B7Y56_08680 [Gallionellales bacterium 35-53-114]OYZ62700.1 MAG: hypothetical protein B7Y04_12535 [Gallionellales bacterium 24-53-125]OZB09776.1 MAG: hypothetical protein B7X61_04435 [Gallionellales bacterium 39-52-133]HQS57662.1 VWA domain-containing protein [Gallionellaceae bacterium]HQS74116.1 VWA domain-containing protein [Gallionellaceae bacterium]
MMNWAAMSQLEWTHPLWALVALQPLLMGLLLKLRRRQILHYADAHLLAWALRGSAGVTQGSWRGVLNVAAWLLLAGALAGPRVPLVSDPEQHAIQRHALDVMVLLDVSPSMQARDISPQRLQRAKLELLDLLPKLHGERVGLIAFSGSAGMVMPLSRDYAALRYYLQLAEPSLFDAPGTAIASALDLALRKLDDEKSSHRAMLLLTDAESSALSGPAGAAIWESADKLKQAGIPLYILGVGTAEGSVIIMPDGNTLVSEGADVVSSLDQAGFAELANKTGGKFALVQDGDADWGALYERGLLTLPGGKQAAENVQAWQELYAWLLLPALLLFVLPHISILLNVINKLQIYVWVMIFAVFSTAQQAEAAETHSASAQVADISTAARAYAAYLKQDHRLAQTLYADLPGFDARMGEGAAAYRRKDFNYAIKQFSTALLQAREAKQREQALYNLGNSYFMTGAYRAAADAFLGVLKYAADNQAARANLALAAGKLAEAGKSAKNTQGIPGRRGRETGGTPGDDSGKESLSIESDEDKKQQALFAGSEPLGAGAARLRTGEQADGNRAATSDGDIAYRAALKKLELATDQPAPLHKALIRIEAAREYVPQLEMAPW